MNKKPLRSIMSSSEAVVISSQQHGRCQERRSFGYFTIALENMMMWTIAILVWLAASIAIFRLGIRWRVAALAGTVLVSVLLALSEYQRGKLEGTVVSGVDTLAGVTTNVMQAMDAFLENIVKSNQAQRASQSSVTNQKNVTIEASQAIGASAPQHER